MHPPIKTKTKGAPTSVPILHLAIRGPIWWFYVSKGWVKAWKCMQKNGAQVYCKGGNTIKSFLMTPKDKDPIMKKSGILYRYKCSRVECDDEYIGESPRTFGERFREHLKAPSPICDHFNITGHSTTIDSGEGGPESEHNYQRSNIHKGE